MKLILHGHGVDSIIFDAMGLMDLYLINSQWKELLRLCRRSGIKLHGFPQLAIADIADDEVSHWEELWNRWSPAMPVSKGYSWEISEEPVTHEKFINYRIQLKNTYAQSSSYKPFIKECDLCGRAPYEKREGKNFYCSPCYKWHKRKQRILKVLNFKYDYFTVVQCSFHLAEDVKSTIDIIDLYKKSTPEDNKFMVYQNMGQITFALKRQDVFDFIEKLKEEFFSKGIPANIMITVSKAPVDMADDMKLGELILFCHNRLDIMKSKSIQWHMQWVQSQNYIKMPKYLYDFKDGMDWNSFKLLKDCLEKFYSLFSREDVRILSNIVYSGKEGQMNYELSKFQFLCNVNQKEYLDFLIKALGFNGIKEILKYRNYHHGESYA